MQPISILKTDPENSEWSSSILQSGARWDFHQPLRAIAAAIPPTTTPTAVAARPIPITPSEYSNKSVAVIIDAQAFQYRA